MICEPATAGTLFFIGAALGALLAAWAAGAYAKRLQGQNNRLRQKCDDLQRQVAEM